MRRLLLLLLALPMLEVGQANEPQTTEELRLIEKIYYDRGEYIASDEERGKLKDLVFEMRADSALKVRIIGFSDKWGGKAVNDRFSYVRARYIADWMRSCRVPREQIVFVSEGIDSLETTDAEARRVEILQVLEVVVEKETEKVAETTEAVAEATETAEVVEIANQVRNDAAEDSQQVPENSQQVPENSQSEPIKEPKQPFEWKNFTLRTNLLYWLGGMMNIGTEYKHADSDFGYVLNGGFSPFGNTGWNRNFGGWFVAPEVRYYFPSNEQWFVGAQFLAGGYNIKLSDIGRQGSVVGGGVMGGYKLTLSDSFDMDFTLGLGYGHFKYDTYYHDEATGTNPYKARGVVKNTLMPIQAGVNLIWKIK